jgi:hypothetical protein
MVHVHSTSDEFSLDFKNEQRKPKQWRAALLVLIKSEGYADDTSLRRVRLVLHYAAKLDQMGHADTGTVDRILREP